MTIEEQLKRLILTKYRSIRAFTKDINVPYSTIDTMFKRGIGGTAVSTIIKICKKLEIDTDALGDGKIVSKRAFSISDLKDEEQNIIRKYRLLNDLGKEKMQEQLDDVLLIGKYLQYVNSYNIKEYEKNLQYLQELGKPLYADDVTLSPGQAGAEPYLELPEETKQVHQEIFLKRMERQEQESGAPTEE